MLHMLTFFERETLVAELQSAGKRDREMLKRVTKVSEIRGDNNLRI